VLRGQWAELIKVLEGNTRDRESDRTVLWKQQGKHDLTPSLASLPEVGIR
jgi:hypothetical protein